MTHGSNLAREEEYQKFLAAELPVEVYSPVQNKSINDKSAMTEEENNRLAEKIVAADVERLWNSDYTIMNPEQSAIGTMVEMGILYGWQYMCNKVLDCLNDLGHDIRTTEDREEAFEKVMNEIIWPQFNKQNYAHYFDIRTNHLNEKDWRRSFSINQFLYGIILAATTDNTLHDNFDEALAKLSEGVQRNMWKYENAT